LKERWSDKKAILVRLAIAAALAAGYAAAAHAASAGLEVSRISVPVAGLPAELDGLRIAEVADLHSSWYGADQSGLVQPIADFRPDIVALTGDFIDGKRPDAAPCEALVRALASIAPVYLIMGNHEHYLDDADLASFVSDMEACGARVLVNAAAIFEKNGAQCLIAGMDDTARFLKDLRMGPSEKLAYEKEIASGFMAEIEASAPEGDYPFKLMLCHEPQYWQFWRDGGYGLALCGHLHGWIFRAPGIGGVLRRPSPFFPEADAGLYDKDGVMAYISRGLDNRNVLSNFRMNNRPELALITVAREALVPAGT
jgi:predicted MPP superfamily phosphohydrolase